MKNSKKTPLELWYGSRPSLELITNFIYLIKIIGSPNVYGYDQYMDL